MDETETAQPIHEHSTINALAFWGPLAAVVWTGLIYGSQFVFGALLIIYPTLRHWNRARAVNWLNNSAIAQFVGTVIIEASAVAIVFLLLRHYRASGRTIGLSRAKLRDAWYALVGFGAYFLVFYGLSVVAMYFIPTLNTNQQQDVGFGHVVGAASLAVAFISLVTLPPLAEEIIFRGFLFTGLRRKFGFLLATLGTSVLFALPHLTESKSGGLLWIAGLDTFVLSLVLCFLREKTNRLWAGIGVHALKNGAAFLTLFIFQTH